MLHLHRNLGHQKAIAIGLSYAHAHLAFDAVLVMDADGEDRPQDIPRMLQAAQGDTIVLARRASRQDNLQFKIFYALYRIFFRLLTGRRIAFGNFMLLPRTAVATLVYQKEIWNHLAGAVLKARLPFQTIDAHRGHRYQGHSKMNFTALILHGLGAISVFMEVIVIRLLLLSLTLIGVSALALIFILGIRFFTQAAIPGWATTAFSSMLIVLLQSFLLSLFTLFLYLTSQAQRPFIPARHYNDYLSRVETL